MRESRGTESARELWEGEKEETQEGFVWFECFDGMR